MISHVVLFVLSRYSTFLIKLDVATKNAVTKMLEHFPMQSRKYLPKFCFISNSIICLLTFYKQDQEHPFEEDLVLPVYYQPKNQILFAIKHFREYRNYQCDHICIFYYQSCLDLAGPPPPVLNVAIL